MTVYLAPLRVALFVCVIVIGSDLVWVLRIVLVLPIALLGRNAAQSKQNFIVGVHFANPNETLAAQALAIPASALVTALSFSSQQRATSGRSMLGLRSLAIGTVTPAIPREKLQTGSFHHLGMIGPGVFKTLS